MPPKRTSTSEAPAMTQAAIRKLVADSVTAALEAQAATMANADNTNRNTGERETPVARKCSYKEFISCQPFNFKGSEGVKLYPGGILLPKPIGIEEAYKITWVEFKKLLIKKPFKLDSFDVVIGMDWLSKYHARIICDEKVVHIPIKGETLIIRGIDQGLGSTSGIRAFALRNFDLEVMEFESAHGNTTAKLPILKLGEYEMWVIRIKQYFQIQDYALWEVIENGNSWVSVPQTAQENGYEATKKTQKTLLKQQYENFSAISTESLDSIFNRLQKIVSRLDILGVVISQEDLNSKFLSSLPPEWNTHVVVWINKPEIETISINDLYNNFKIVEQKVKKSVGASSGAQNLAFMTVQALAQDLEQIHEDDLEAMDLRWQLSLLSMRAKRECRAPRNKEGQFRYQDNTRKQGNKEDTSSKAMLAIDGVGFD
ncbi:hypothetical protein Tco_0869585 [Tanacetum coccineum]